MTKRLVRGVGILAAVVALLWGPAAVPAAASPTRPLGWCGNWSNSFSKGHAYGDACGGHVHGWVVDDQNDGYCVFVRVYWDDPYGPTSDSGWACPKGTKREFTLDNASWWDHISIEAIYVG
jgi:hypothetical protein